jgi:single-stranded DNA-specific DHH superfamily exonuclease
MLVDVKKALTSYRREIGKSMRIFEDNKGIIEEKKHATYAMAGDLVSEDIISNVISIVSRSGYVSEHKPVFAFVNTEDGDIKISARLGDNEDKGYGLNDIIAKASMEMGGEGGGHKFAAGATIPKGSEQMFINRMEEILKEFNGHAKQTEDIKTVGDNNHDAESRNSELLNNKHTELVNSQVKIDGTETDVKAQEGGQPGGNKKMEGKGLVRYFNS